MNPGQRLKNAAKQGLKQCARRAAHCFPPAPNATRILTYHSIGHRDHEMNVRPDDFLAQMEWLAAQQCAIPLAEAAQGRPGVALTFDDGYLDNLTHAAPILSRLALPATVFMVADRIGQELVPPRSAEGKAGELSSPSGPTAGSETRLMNWEELSKLQAMGIEVGSHTLSHRRLATLSEAEQRTEIFDSKQRLEEKLGQPIQAFAYPFGSALDYTPATVHIVREAGFAYATSNRFGPVQSGDDRFTLRRIWIDGTDDLSSFQAKVRGDLDLLRLMDSYPGILARRAANALLLRRG